MQRDLQNVFGIKIIYCYTVKHLFENSWQTIKVHQSPCYIVVWFSNLVIKLLISSVQIGMLLMIDQLLLVNKYVSQKRDLKELILYYMCVTIFF